MAPRRRRPTYYTAVVLNDGTMIGAYPIRKPWERRMKEDEFSVDADFVCKEIPTDPNSISDVRNEGRGPR